jgi:hypothetical protein
MIGDRFRRPGLSHSSAFAAGLSLLPARSSPFSPPIEFGICGAAFGTSLPEQVLLALVLVGLGAGDVNVDHLLAHFMD